MTAWWSRTILLGAVAATALLPVGALGARFGLWDWTIGVLLVTVGSGLVVVGAGSATAAVLIARRRQLPDDLRAAGIGLALCLLAVGYMGMQLLAAVSVPPIHHVSTDTGEPPQFIEVPALRGPDSNPLDYDAETIAPLQAEAYPWLMPLTLQATPEAAFAKARAALEDMGMEIVAEHPLQGLIEATATTFWFGFKDDVAVRVRPHPQGALVDARSISRVGVSDMGLNAERIGEILRRLSGGNP